MNLLITGGAGFIGSNFIPFLLERYSNAHVVNLDKLTYAGNLDNLKEVENHPRYTFVQGDICNSQLVQHLFEQYEFNGVIHFAAESHVDNSIKNPAAFVKTNVLGTFTLLEVARDYWMEGSNKYKTKFGNARFHHISTDEVFGTLGHVEYFTETSQYAPNSPYSASKASSDMLVRSYFHTYGMNVVTTNCSNNYGPKQHEEKLIPTIIRKAIALEDIPIYGNGKNIRDWLYVTDHCRGIERVFYEGKPGEIYLIGGHNEKTNIEIAETICSILDKVRPLHENKKGITSYKQLIKFVQDRPGHDFRYAINPKKIETELSWKPEFSFQNGIKETVMWYLYSAK
ncbi:dTDP-glucose 4,6-dehydratase [Robertmurraya andreesenii]|uniref:dTDP-glucose 4,6-dehydratase n=1 Tax=Anoxybacillus andreesenii TaxID=1325932 RepID=A0ABT9V7I4_9BACL|nr:dTDP-glucose 4,6-dehydratase [Robertmurraya andreesenii]MDQ0156901.1 dTDP-glucose 4,6-dehydratase [Robertmurraya andreesenii]